MHDTHEPHDSCSEDEQEAGSEDLDTAMQNLLASAPVDTAAASEAAQPQLQKHPEVVDDFVRNFLVRTGLRRALEAFETEWCVFCAFLV